MLNIEPRHYMRTILDRDAKREPIITTFNRRHKVLHITTITYKLSCGHTVVLRNDTKPKKNSMVCPFCMEEAGVTCL